MPNVIDINAEAITKPARAILKGPVTMTRRPARPGWRAVAGKRATSSYLRSSILECRCTASLQTAVRSYISQARGCRWMWTGLWGRASRTRREPVWADEQDDAMFGALGAEPVTRARPHPPAP